MSEVAALPAPPPVVLEIGSSVMKTGLATDSQPRHIFPNVIGRPRIPQQAAEEGATPKYYIGSEAIANRDKLSIKYPVYGGVVCNWDDMDTVWKHAFEQLQVNSEDQPLLLVDCVLQPSVSREKTTQVFFETFNTPSLYIGSKNVLTLLSTGRLSGLCVQSGDSVTYCSAVYEGHPMPRTIPKCFCGGSEVTHQLLHLLEKKGCSLKYHVANDIKEKHAFVSRMKVDDGESGSATFEEISYTLPDGNIVQIGEERTKCTDVLFLPDFEAYDPVRPIPEAINQCVRWAAEEELQFIMVQNIVLGGGNCSFPNMAGRLKDELTDRLPGYLRKEVRISVADDPCTSAWRGGAVFASMFTFPDMCMTKEEYDEYGPNLVKLKCF